MNHRVNLLCLKALRDGLFDFLVIPQDDAAEYGYMCVEQREIRRRIAEYRIGTRCYLYPGADEAGCTHAGPRRQRGQGGAAAGVYPLQQLRGRAGAAPV